jgi:hypothetical protein
VSAPAIRHDRGHFWHDPHRSAVASLLTVPAMLAWMALLMPVGWGLQSALGLDDTEMLYEAGAWGVAAFGLMSVLSAVPPTVGIVLGVRARRLGERRLGTMGVAANAVVAVLFVLAPVLQALFA